MPQPLYEFGGSGALINLAVANGFPPEVYHPLVTPLTKNYRVVSLPPRAMWPGEPAPEAYRPWKETIAVDLLNGLRAYDMRDVIAIGHSFGAVASLLAAIAEPERFKALVLLDPTILPPSIMAVMAEQQASGEIQNNVLGQRAEKRRATFENTQAAYDYFKSKRLFSNWPDETVRLYAETLVPVKDGSEVQLAWSAAWEAYYFRTLYTDTWDEIPKLTQTNLPILVLRGGTSDTFLAEAMTRMQSLMPDATYGELQGYGHLFPQEAPDETRERISHWLVENVD